MIGRNTLEVLVGLLANGAAWAATTEQIWFPIAAAYVRYIGPIYNLPDMRGPLAFISLAYIGLRLGDLWNARDDMDDTMEDMT